MTYHEADRQLQGRCYQSRKLQRNTYLQRRYDNIAVRLHHTDILSFRPDGSWQARTGGWDTITTRDRLPVVQYAIIRLHWRVGTGTIPSGRVS